MYLSSHGFLEAEENGDMENGEEQIFGEIMGIVGDRIGILDLNLTFYFFLPFTPSHLNSLICSDFCSQFLISKSEILGVENWCTSLYFFLFLLAFLLLALLVAAIFGKCRLECFKRRLRTLVTCFFHDLLAAWLRINHERG